MQKNFHFLLGFFIIFVIVFLNAIGPYLSLQQYATLGLIPILGGIAFLFDVRDISSGKKEFSLFLLIFLSSFSTVFYYIGYDEFIRNVYLMLGAVIGAFVVIGLTKKIDYSLYFHLGYIFSILALFLIMIKEGNITVNFASALDYRNRFMLNANAYSYYCVFANFSLFYLYLIYKNRILLFSLFLLPLIFLVIAFTTQSRAGLALIILINIMFWFFVNKSDNLSRLKKLFKTILYLIIFLAISYKFMEIYEGSRISSRISQTAEREDSREILFKEGIEVFTENPIFGVGLGQFPFYSRYNLFTHNSYTEILSEQGIIGGIFLFSLFLIPTFKSFNNFRKDSKNPIFRCNLLFFIVFILYNNAYVFYKFPFSMMYFFLIISIQNRQSNINETLDISISNKPSINK
tara:strand:+ start:288 stop:1499 length:1212 start_codon:yes stop_codon:yes gene_type:complete